MICPSRKEPCDNGACLKHGCQGGISGLGIFLATVRADLRMFFFAAGLSLAPFVAALADSAPPVLPDPTLTPGVIASTDVTQVCAHNTTDGTYSQQHRLTTAGTKKQIFAEYGMTVPVGAARHEFEIDHLVPLCIGGKDDVHNLWPQYREGPWGYPVKDKLEAYACREVCAGKIPLATAQAWFTSSDWRVAYCAVALFVDDKNCHPK